MDTFLQSYNSSSRNGESLSYIPLLSSDAEREEERVKINLNWNGEKALDQLDDGGLIGEPVIEKKWEGKVSFSPEDFEYNMKNEKRGYFIIFNQDTFDARSNLAQRPGSNVDCANMREIAQKLGFEHIKVYRNLCEKEILDMLEEVRSMDHSNFDCLICVILSRGEEGEMVFAKDIKMHLSKFMEPFNAKNCPTLSGKPKLFFVQACRGNVPDKPAKPADQPDMPPEEEDALGGQGSCLSTKDEKVTMLIPAQSDFLIAHSTPKSFQSWRSRAKGSWFIQALHKCFLQYGHELELMQIMTKVNNMVAENFNSYACAIQIPSIATQLRAEVTFKPKPNGSLYKALESINLVSHGEKSNPERGIQAIPNENEHDAVVEEPTQMLFEATDPKHFHQAPSYFENFGSNFEVLEGGFSFRDYKFDIKNNRCGWMLMFIQDKFDERLKLPWREGSDVDIQLMRDFAFAMGFQRGAVLHNYYRSEILDLIQHVKSQDHSNYDCFACAILSHGGVEDIIWARDAPMHLWEFMQPFNAINCPTLSGKPKLFFIQACRGIGVDKPAKSEDLSNLPRSSSNAEATKPTIDEVADNDCEEMKSVTIPGQSDFLIAYASPPNFVSWRNPELGSWFVKALHKCFLEYGHELELMQIMTKVNNIMAGTPMYKGQAMQISSIVSQLRYEVRFEPKPDPHNSS